jgi:hypothetical protein
MIAWQDQKLNSRSQGSKETLDMRDHEKMWTIESSRLWTIDLTPFWSFGYQELECRNTSSQKCLKCEMPKYLQIISGFVTWSVETLHHRNAEMSKCETPKYLQIISGFVTWSVETLHHRNVEMRNAEIPSDHFGVRDLECRNTSSQECLKCRNVGMR